MGNHEIQFQTKGTATYTVTIDGHTVCLSCRKNKIKYGDTKSLSSYLEALGERVVSGGDFCDLAGVVNGCNMLTLLSTFFRGETKQNWAVFYRANKRVSFYVSFKAMFGCRHDLKTCPSDFVEELIDIALEIQQESGWKEQVAAARSKRCEEFASVNLELFLAEDANWRVERVPGNENNVISFLVNNKKVDVCVSRDKQNGDPNTLLTVLNTMKKGLSTDDREVVKEAIQAIGSSAALRVLESLFHDEAIDFFNKQLESSVKEMRVPPQPNKLLKQFFQGNASLDKAFLPELFDILETKIPDLELFLINSSEIETTSDKNEWKLYYQNNGVLCAKRIVFWGSDEFKKELRQYYRFRAEASINSGKNYVTVINRIHSSIKSIIDAIESSPASILELNVWDIRKAISAIRAESRISLGTERRALFCLREFIAFYDVDLARKVIPDSLIPPRIINPTKPIDPYVISQITSYKGELIPCVWLALRVYLQTGTRVGSLCSIITSQLVHQGDRWFLRIYYGKTENREGKAGRPNFRIHELKDGLGPEIYTYIQETKVLRSLLNKPYIFIFASNIYRDGTKRKPKVLSSDTFIDNINALCKKHKIVDSEGMPAKCSPMMIRAEVGRGMLASGKSLQETANKLGNSCIVVAMHYNKRYPADEAKMHRQLFAKTLDDKIGFDLAQNDPCISPNSPMYGTCHDSTPCHNHNDCRNCSISIKCKQSTKKDEKGA